MAYRNFNARRHGGAATGSEFVWPFQYPQVSRAAAWPHSRPPRAPQYESWEPSDTPGVRWPIRTAPSTGSNSSQDTIRDYTDMNPLDHRQTGINTRNQATAVGTRGTIGNATFPPSSADGVPIDLALNGIYEAVASAGTLFESYEAAFNQQAAQVAAWATPGTLDKLWRDMIKSRDDADRHRSLTDRITNRLASLKTALKASSSGTFGQMSVGKANRSVIERRVRAARKAMVHCEEVLDLLLRARTERTACSQLVEEIGELMDMLNPKTHVMLYHDSDEEKAEQEDEWWKEKDVAKGMGTAKGKEKAKGKDRAKDKEKGKKTNSFRGGYQRTQPQDLNDGFQEQSGDMEDRPVEEQPTEPNDNAGWG